MPVPGGRSGVETLLGDRRRQSGRAWAGVVDAVRTRCRAALLRRCGLPWSHPTRGHQEPGVAGHLVAGTHRQTLDVLVADQALPGLRRGEAPVSPEGLDD